MSFNDHLRSHQNVRLMSGKSCQDLLITVFCPCGIKIHSKDTGFGKFFFQDFLDLLGSGFKSTDMRRTTGRTGFRFRNFISAVMADQTVAIMFT